MGQERLTGGVCPRCSAALAGARWCPTCGLDTTPDASSLPSPDLYEAIRRERDWLAANPGHEAVTSYVPPPPEEPEKVDHSRVPTREQLAEFKPIERPARITVWLLWAGVALLLVTILVDIERIQVFGDLAADRVVGQDELEASDTRSAVVGAVQAVVFLVTAIFFVRWFHRSYRNLRALGMRRRYGTGWAIGAWFVPFLNFVRPKKIANDIWRESDPDIDTPVRELGAGPLPALLNWWWAIYLSSSLFDSVAAQALVVTEDDASLQNAYAADIVASCVDIVSALLAIAVVRRMTARQLGRKGAADTRLAAEVAANAPLAAEQPATRWEPPGTLR